MSATHTPLPSLETTCIKRGTPPPQHALDEATHDRDSPSNPQSRWEEPSGVEVGDEEPDHAVAMAGLLEIGNQGGWILKTAELEIGRQIGLGSVGAVYKGKHIASGKTVAVKVVRDDLMLRTREGNRILEDLACEIDQLAKIGPHPNIVGFVGANIDASAEPVIVLEYMDGGCLQDVLAAKSKNGRSWRPPKETSISWCAQLCSALDFMHDRGTPLVHRDIKPANLLCSADLKTLKLGDFGLCRPIQTPHGGPFARAMTGVTGTMSHMAPEVLFASDGYSEKADVFSAAVCMVHLITGKQAYTAAQTQEWSPETLARRVALEGYRAPLEHRIKNKDMRDLLSSMWAHDPRERPSAAQCEVELVALLATVREKGSLSPFATLRRSFSLPTNKPELVNPLPPASSGELQARRHSLTGDLLKRVLKPFGALKMPFSSASTASSDEPHNPAARSAAHNRYGSEPPAAVRRHSEDPTASGIPILGGESSESFASLKKSKSFSSLFFFR